MTAPTLSPEEWDALHWAKPKLNHHRARTGTKAGKSAPSLKICRSLEAKGLFAKDTAADSWRLTRAGWRLRHGKPLVLSDDPFIAEAQKLDEMELGETETFTRQLTMIIRQYEANTAGQEAPPTAHVLAQAMGKLAAMA